MAYFLKTSLVCNNSCVYCCLLNKKNSKDKDLNEIKREIIEAKNKGYKEIKLSCNTDIRKDFIEILKLIKEHDFIAILETNARIFNDVDFFKKVDKYIKKYEIYLSFFNKESCQDMIGDKKAYEQTIRGIYNISELSKKEKVIKIVLVKDILVFLISILRSICQLRIKNVKFILPFIFNNNDQVSSVIEVISDVASAKKFAQENNINIVEDRELEYNPFLSKSQKFFEKNNLELKVKYQKYKQKPKISVVIPVYNRKEFLNLVLKSFFQQNYQKSKYEIIVVDDGSDDGTMESIKNIKPTCNFKYFYWPREKRYLDENITKWNKFYNRAGLARNIGVDNSTGEIILFNDSDILAQKDCLKRHEIYHKKYTNIVVRGFRYFLPECFNKGLINNEISKFLKPEKTTHEIGLHCRMHDLSKEGWHRIVTANLSLRRKYFYKAGGFSKDCVFWGSEDIDLGFRLSKLKMKFIWDNNIKVFHLYHPKQSEPDLSILIWLVTNLLYRKYFDENIVKILGETIFCHLDKLILPTNDSC